MIIEIAEASSKSKWQFDDSGPIAMEQMVDSLTGIRWVKDDEKAGACPMVPKAIMDRYEAVKLRASGLILQSSLLVS